MVDCTIVGQGIAGTCMAIALLARGLSVRVFADEEGHMASLRAAGVINPITGRRFVKTWQADEVIPLAWKFYSSLEQWTGVSGLISARTILHSMNEPIMEENWLLREGDEAYRSYMGVMKRLDHPALAIESWYGEIHGALQVNMAETLRVARKYVQEAPNGGSVIFKHYTTLSADLAANPDSRYLIFCEGSAVNSNPYFNFLPHLVAKGEALICHIPDLQSDAIFKADGISVAPMWEDQLYWVGSTYEWDNYDPAPTPEARRELERKLKLLLKCPFEVVDHVAGIRPTARDRRPFVGPHPKHPNILLLNGLGTKGASLAPYCAEALARFIVDGEPIAKGMNLLRYYKS